MKTVANLFATSYARLGSDRQQDRQFISLERLPPDEDSYCTFVKRVESLAQNEYWIAREKNILMLLKRVPHVARLRKEEEKNRESYQTIKTKDAGISLAHWLRTKPQLAENTNPCKHPLAHVQCFLQFARYTLIALKELHQVGVIHAQLRPDNICIPYQPHPYTFDTALSLNFSKLSLIDFMFAVSNTLKLSRPLPVVVNPTASTQSSLMRHALLTDQQQRHADLITRIDYSVDLYALGFILEQIFQQDLIYPAGLDAELSMEIHRFILELKSYDHGIPNAVKLRHLHLHPHNEYIAKIDYLLTISLQGNSHTTIGFLFDPAQFLEEDSIFHVNASLVVPDNTSMVESTAPPIQSTLEPVATSALPLVTSVEIKTMKETTPASLSHTQATDYIELSKLSVIALIVSLQICYVLYTDGNNMGLDVLSSIGLVAVIGIAIIIGSKVLAPPKPLPKRTVLDDIEDEQPSRLVTPTTTENKTPVIDELDVIAASVLPAVSVAANEQHTIHDTIAPQDLSEEDNAPLANVSLSKNEDDAAATAPLLNKASNISQDKDKDAIEVNKWVVIAIIVACQLSYIGLTTDFGGKKEQTTEAVEPEPSTPEPTETVATTEPMPTEMPPEDGSTSEVLPTAPNTHSEASAANIELLTESSSVSTPQITPKTRTKDVASESILLSGSPVEQEAKPKKEKAPTVAKTKNVAQTTAEEPARQTAIPLTKEQAEAADKTPVAAEPVVAAKEPTPNVTETKTETTSSKAEVKQPKSLTRGLAEAQNAMGYHYYHGDGVPKNLEESFKWFQKAANLGQPSAQFNVGMMYQKGEGVKQDLGEAAKWYRKSAEQNHASAQLNLGMMYISGRGVRQNIDEGAKLLNKAAEQGDATAKANLTWLLQQGFIKEIPTGE